MVETTYNIPGSPRLALLADLHGRPYDHIISSLQAHRPSLVCVVGDILYGSHPEDDRSPLDTQENVLPFLTACATIAPTFLSLGNHEWMLDAADLKLISSTGVTVLDNDYKTINIDGRKIVLAGLTSGYVTDYRAFRDTQDGAERYPKKEDLSGIGGAVTASQHVPDTDWLEDFTAASPGDAHILLSHHPEYWPDIKEKEDRFDAVWPRARRPVGLLLLPKKENVRSLVSGPRVSAALDAGRVRRPTCRFRWPVQHSQDTEDM